jgi:hypothetical protein
MFKASPARIAANKANAQKSTGPRTEAGKLRVSANALKHGLRSERNPLDLATASALSIERDEFLTTLAAFKADLQPQGPIETRLIERLAQIDLRLQRALRLETTHLENKFHETVADATKAGSPIATDTGRTRDNWLLMFAFLRDPAALKLISQYESRLARDFARTLTQLRQSQALRVQGGVQNLSEQTQQPATFIETPYPPVPAESAPRSQSTAVGSCPPDRESDKQTQTAPSAPERAPESLRAATS